MSRLGLIVNPVAGIGGSVGLKGSDGPEIQQQAQGLGGIFKANQRAAATLTLLAPMAADIEWFVCPGCMGQQVIEPFGFKTSIIDISIAEQTSEVDTRSAVKKMNALDLDLLLFVGGDGTARDICSSVRSEQLVLGIPAGVKMQSGVFAITPEAAAGMISKFVRREQLNLRRAEVRDIDEEARRAGKIASRYYGELWVPDAGNSVQRVKCCGLENEQLDKQEIAAGFIEGMADSIGYLMCPGSTVEEVMNQLGLQNTLLGVDLIRDSQLIGRDLTERQVLDFLNQGAVNIVVSPIGGQGYLFGRGNQQISSEVIKKAGKDNITVLATRTKLAALEGRALLVDTGEPALNKLLCGYVRVNTGFDDSILYPVAAD
jgi:predicted polyphosphate/ATP-dependent NAD kinase